MIDRSVVRHCHSWLSFVVLLLGLSCALAEQQASEDVAFFENRIRPVLVEHCYDCHSQESKILQAGLLVDFREGLRVGGDSGAAVVPGKPEESLLLDALRYDGFEMPPSGKLPERVIADFEQWIRRGAVDPREATVDLLQPSVLRREDGVLNRIDYEQGQKFWSLQPIADPKPPAVVNERWVSTPVDRFVLAKLEKQGIKPSSEASKLTLLRRLKFDLLGLPPTPTEVEDFLADDAADAYERLVKRFLASTHYGERWGRYWLDLVRYSDSNGMDENKYFAHAWRYRDYVIRSLNGDKPYDQFLTEQIAGDLLDFDEVQTDRAAEALTATSFLALGPKMDAEPDNQKRVMDTVDEMIDVTTKTVLGMSGGCARCHDHKFDPVSHADYYALAGVFRGAAGDIGKIRNRTLPMPVERTEELKLARDQHKALGEKLKKVRKELIKVKKDLLEKEEDESLLNDEQRKQIKEIEAKAKSLNDERKVLKKQINSFPTVHSIHARKPENLPIHIRGSHTNLAKKKVPRGVPQVFDACLQPPTIGEEATGRLELARWLTDAKHPLTARVMVNRIWLGHFGEGIVATPSDFGFQGSRPTHPELLDYLAQEFIRSGWSMKHMHRLMVLSSTYRQASVYREGAAAVDGENQLLWRQNRRRLEVEPLRDSLLSVAGRLDLKMGGSEFVYPDGQRVTNDQSANAALATYQSQRRAIYLPVIRVAIYSMFADFDLCDTSIPIDRRNSSVVAPQALFMLNSDLVRSAAADFAERLVDDDTNASVRRAYLLAFGRKASDEEVRMAVEYLRQGSWQDFCQALLASSEFLYVD